MAWISFRRRYPFSRVANRNVLTSLPRRRSVYVAPAVRLNFPFNILHREVLVHGQENFLPKSSESFPQKQNGNGADTASSSI